MFLIANKGDNYASLLSSWSFLSTSVGAELYATLVKIFKKCSLKSKSALTKKVIKVSPGIKKKKQTNKQKNVNFPLNTY